jgi:hypothetical protein
MIENVCVVYGREIFDLPPSEMMGLMHIHYTRVDDDSGAGVCGYEGMTSCAVEQVYA